MKVFIENCHSYIGKAVGAAFSAAGHEITGTVEGQEYPDWVQEPLLSGTDEADEEEAVERMMTCDAIVVQIEGREAQVKSAVMKLANAKHSGKEKVFIGISNALTWAATTLPDSMGADGIPDAPPGADVFFNMPTGMLSRTTSKAPSMAASMATSAAPSGARPGTVSDKAPVTPEVASAAEADLEAEGDPSEDPMMPPPPPEAFAMLPLTGFDFERRIGAVAAKGLVAAENCILRAARKNKLATYILCPGILYGRGEVDHMGLHHLFKAAYECQPIPSYGPGGNLMPTVHVDDLATYCMVVVEAKPAHQYLLVADDGQMSQGSLIQTIKTELGNGEVSPMSYEDLVFNTGHQYLLLNLPFQISPIGESVPELKYSKGLIPHIKDVYKEYLDTRNLHPIRLLLRGGPSSGKTYIAKELSKEYMLRHIDAKEILEHRKELPDEDELRKEVEAQVSSKEGRVSDKNMALLAYRLLTTLHISHKGYILDGVPRTLNAMKWLCTKERPPTEEELEEKRKEEEAAAAEQGGKGGKGGKDKGGKDKGGKPAKGGKEAVDEGPPTDVPRELATEVLPTLAITLEVPEEVSTKRAGETYAAEKAELDKKIAEGLVDAKKPPPPSHDNEKDFQRRMGAWKALRGADEADLQSIKDVIKAAYDAEFAEYEAKKAEYDAAVAAAAEAEAQLQEGGGSPKGEQGELPPIPDLPEPPAEPVYPEYGGLDKWLVDTQIVKMINMDAWPDEPPPPPPPEELKSALEHSKSLTFKDVEVMEEEEEEEEEAGDEEEEEEQEEETEEEKAAREKAENERDAAERQRRFAESIREILGEPHNYEGRQEEADMSDSCPPQPVAELSAQQIPETDDGASVFGAASVFVNASPILMDGYIAAKKMDNDRLSAPIQKFLVENVVPSITKALVEVCRVRPENPLEYVGNMLLDAGKEIDAAYSDPYEDEIYAIQAEKIRSKAEREKIRAVEREARDARDAALRAELDTMRASSRGLPEPGSESRSELSTPKSGRRTKSPPKSASRKGGKKK